MLELLARRWGIVLCRGISAILMGTVTVLWPGMTITILLFLFGAFTVADGITAVWLGLSAKHGSRVWWEMVAAGAIAIVAGFIAAIWPGLTAMAFVFLIGIFALVRGATEIVAAIHLRKVIDDEWMLVLSGIVSLLFGGILVARPGDGALAMAFLIGAFMIAVGAMTVGLALRLRQLAQKLERRDIPTN